MSRVHHWRTNPSPTLHDEGSTAPSQVEMQPIRWSPEHDKMVGLHIMGYTAEAIGGILDYHPNRISVILNDPRARTAIIEARKRIRERSIQSVEETLSELAERSVGRLAETIDAKVDVGTRAKMHQDNTAFKILELTGHSKAAHAVGDGEGRGRVLIEGSLGNKLIEAITKSDQAHAMQEVDATVVKESPSE